jgi:ribosomal protein S18 acetylase RimI-like enzyme
VHPILREVDRVADLPRLQAIASSALGAGGPRYTVHPGDLAWWVHHQDPRLAASESYWLWEDRGFVVLGEDEINAFARPGEDVIPLVEWGEERLGGGASVAWVARADRELTGHLSEAGYEVAWSMLGFERSLTTEAMAGPTAPTGWELRPLRGEEEADNRRRASFRAFESTMDPEQHLQRYLRFMRSPVYEAERDLVAVSPEGRIASFLVWWADPSGIAQIEPLGTDPDFQRQGAAAALVEYAAVRMAAAGMHTVRVCTQESRTAASRFYPAAGFNEVDRLDWWRRP